MSTLENSFSVFHYGLLLINILHTGTTELVRLGHTNQIVDNLDSDDYEFRQGWNPIWILKSNQILIKQQSQFLFKIDLF